MGFAFARARNALRDRPFAFSTVGVALLSGLSLVSMGTAGSVGPWQLQARGAAQVVRTR